MSPGGRAKQRAPMDRARFPWTLVALALVACDSFAQAQPEHSRSGRLHAIVNAWLKPDAKEGAANGGLNSPPFTKTEQDIVTRLSAEPLPERPVYPAPRLLEKLLETSPGPAIVHHSRPARGCAAHAGRPPGMPKAATYRSTHAAHRSTGWSRARGGGGSWGRGWTGLARRCASCGSPRATTT